MIPILVGIGLPIFFIAIWLFVTTILALVAGWFALAKRYPDRPEPAILTMQYLSGVMGPSVRMNGVLRFATCSSGLRVGIMRLLGPFSRNFFVPWEDIAVVRKDVWLAGSQTEIRFGATGRLTIPSFIADKLAASVPEHWPQERVGH